VLGFGGSIDFWHILMHFYIFIMGTDSFWGFEPGNSSNTPVKSMFYDQSCMMI